MNPGERREARSAGLPLVLLATTLALAACGDDPAGPDEDRMTQDEANALAQGLYGGTLLAYADTLLQADAALLTVLPPGVAFPLDATIPCMGGGEAVFSGNATISGTDIEARIQVDVSGTLAAAGCTFTNDNVTLALDSDPGLAQTLLVTISLETFTFSLDAASSGAFSWTSGTRSGSCTLDNTITSEISMVDSALSGAIPTATITGSVCGLGVNREIELSATVS